MFLFGVCGTENQLCHWARHPALLGQRVHLGKGDTCGGGCPVYFRIILIIVRSTRPRIQDSRADVHEWIPYKIVILYSGKHHLSCSVTPMLAEILCHKYLPAEHSVWSSREHSHQTLFYFVEPRFRCVDSMFLPFLECVLDLRSTVLRDVYMTYEGRMLCAELAFPLSSPVTCLRPLQLVKFRDLLGSAI